MIMGLVPLWYQSRDHVWGADECRLALTNAAARGPHYMAVTAM